MSEADLTSLSVADYLDRLASGDATPGGGSAAALVGALAASLVCMVCRLTLGRDRFAAVADEVTSILERAEELRGRLRSGVAADAAAYGGVMAARGLPRETEAEQAHRTEAVQASLREAARVPLSVAEDCAEVLTLCERAAGRTNPHAASDVAVAALLAGAGLEGAGANVEINLASIKDEAFVSEARGRLADLTEDWRRRVAVLSERLAS